MATKTRYKSSSPAPTPMPLGTSAPASPALASTLSKEIFPSVPRAEQFQRHAELPILNYHNARPSAAEGKIVLPLVSEMAGVEERSAGVGRPLPPSAVETDVRNGDGRDQPFRYTSSNATGGTERRVEEKSRSLSIQSLISVDRKSTTDANARGAERGMKRKGSDDMDDATRSSRGGSVVSSVGLSMEDPDVRDAVEALGGLKADFAHPPTAPQSPSGQTHREPLLNLIQSSPSVHPLLSTALSISSSTYAASKTYIPPFRYVAESAENFTAPVVSAVGRRTGIEDYIRRGLTQHRGSDSADCSRSETKRRKSEKSTNSGEPRQGQLVEVRTNPGWQTRLYYSSTGLATALSDESRRSLRYCLKILFAANANLVKVIETLSTVVEELDAYLRQKSSSSSGEPPSGGIAGYLPESLEQRHKRLSETVDRLKDEALKTLKQVVDTISRYAGGALPEQARNVVKRQLLSFPLKWQTAASWTTQTSAATTTAPAQGTPGEMEKCVVLAEGGDTAGGRTKGKAVRVLVMAREGLDMMRSVTDIVEGTLISADQWCDRFGKARGEEGGQKQRPGAEETEEKGEGEEREGGEGKKKVHKKTVSWVDGEKDADGDVAMAKTR